MNMPVHTEGIGRTVSAYRVLSRQVRAKYRRPNPLARGVSACMLARDRALDRIEAAGHTDLADALRCEDAALHRLGRLRRHEDPEGNADHIRIALANVRAKRRAILYAIERGHI